MRALVIVAHVALAFLCSASPLFDEEQVPFVSIPVGNRRGVITPGLSAYVKNALQTASIPGLSMGIVRLAEGRHLPAVELAAWGKQTEDGDGEDLTPDALFAIASCSKAFLVAAVGLLIDDYAHGRNVTPLPGSMRLLSWDTKMHHLLPDEWSFPEEWAESTLSLRDAFSHLSGLPRHDYSYRPGDTTSDVLRRLRHLPHAYELREQWMYNNQMFMIGAHIVAKLTNAPYRSFVESRILNPLNMSSTTFTPSAAAKTGRLTQTWTRGSRRVPFWFPDAVAELFAGAGGIISSAEDMTKWLAVLLNEGTDPTTNATIIPPAAFTEMTTARSIVSGVAVGDISIMGYGMGWFRMSYRGHDVVWHFGAIPGFSLLVAFLPADNLGAVLLANMDEKQDDNMRMLYRVIDEALGLSHDEEPTVSPVRPETAAHTEDGLIHALEILPVEALLLNLEAYTGTYEDCAYGALTLCGPSSTSEYCSQVLADFAAVDTAQHIPPSEHGLIAAWDRAWSTHVRLRHTSGNSFVATFPRLFPQGYGRNTTPFEFWDSQISVGRAEFVLHDGEVVGFALVTEEQAAAARAKRTGGNLREIADAWFKRAA
ncbi:beta-lactamase/transpeptidase-like protein [Lentinus brumalis]|uniref:Beta-lactamase/transpeptidase-like protein n=1 Tax=Lentinus brumalis TaxID=2498619 RepID=A0A371CT08_9APHY|nr:beta-lactamase/transpeptidase-like protein [Polyporus brumalis]